MKPTIRITRVENGVTTLDRAVCDTAKTALKHAHLIALEDSRDPMGDKQTIPFENSGLYRVHTYWGTTTIKTCLPPPPQDGRKFAATTVHALDFPAIRGTNNSHNEF